MPDWTYQTIFKPALFRLPYRHARGIALGFMGRLGRLPMGLRVIDFFGHMRPAESLAFTWNDITFPTRVGPPPRASYPSHFFATRATRIPQRTD